MNTTLVVYNNLSHYTSDHENKDNKDELEIKLISSYIDTSIVVVTKEDNSTIEFILDIPEDVCVVTKDNKEITGKLLEISDNRVVIEDRERLRTLTVRNYDNVVNKNLKPHYVVLIKQKSFKLSYLINDITWKCVASGILVNNKLLLSFNSIIYNNTNENVQCNLTLVAGTTNSISNNIRYDMGEVKLVKKSIFNISNMEVDVKKIYIHYTNLSSSSFGYLFKSPDNIPTCSCNLYNDNLNNFIGSTNIKEHRKGEEVIIDVSDSSEVNCMNNISSTDISDNITVKIMAEKYPVNLVIKHYVGDKEVTKINVKDYDRKDGYLIFKEQIDKQIAIGYKIEYRK